MKSELEGGNNMKKTRVTWAIVIAVAGLLVSVISTSIAVTQSRYNVRGVDSSYQWSNKYKKNQSMSVIATKKHWTKGKVYYGVNQKSGTKRTQYDMSYQKNNTAYVLEYAKGYTKKNNTFYGEFYAHYTNGKDKYSYKLLKINNKNVQSQMVIDLFVV